MNKNLKSILLKGFVFTAIFTAVSFVFGIQNIQAQRKDHLTDKEADLIRDAQEIDRRVEVFIKAIERRFLVLENKGRTFSKNESKQLEKDSELWGDLPTSPNAKLISDIENILDEAINNIDDAADRDSQKEVFPKAVYKLADAAKDFVPKLKTFYESSTSDGEIADAFQAIKYCDMIIEASSKINRPQEKSKKKKSKS